MFCNHELQWEPQRNGRKSREKQAEPLKDEIYLVYFSRLWVSFHGHVLLRPGWSADR